MTDQPDNLILAMLRRMDAKVDRIGDDMRDLKVRVTAIEMQIGTIDSRLDRIEGRLDRIERRIELVDSPSM